MDSSKVRPCWGEGSRGLKAWSLEPLEHAASPSQRLRGKRMETPRAILGNSNQGMLGNSNQAGTVMSP